MADEAPAIEQPNSSPTPSGTNEPAAASLAAAAPSPEPAPTLPADPGRFPVREEVAPVIVASLPATPAGQTFDDHGRPSQGQPIPPAEQKRVYVQADGTKVDCKVVARRANGMFDIVIPWGTTEIRRDGVQKRQDDSQTGDFLE